jgi:hypothetical protein
MPRHAPDTDELLRRAEHGDEQARQTVLIRHRQRLKHMVALRLDRRLAARIDPSDVVQEALLDAARGFDDYLRRRPLPFYPWLRRRSRIVPSPAPRACGGDSPLDQRLQPLGRGKVRLMEGKCCEENAPKRR